MANAPASILIMDVGRFTVVSLGQAANAPFAIVFAPEEIVIVFKLSH